MNEDLSKGSFVMGFEIMVINTPLTRNQTLVNATGRAVVSDADRESIFNTLVAGVNDIGLLGMYSTLDQMYQLAVFVAKRQTLQFFVNPSQRMTSYLVFQPKNLAIFAHAIKHTNLFKLLHWRMKLSYDARG